MLITRAGKASKTGVMMRMKPASATKPRGGCGCVDQLRIEGPSILAAVIDDDRGNARRRSALEAIRIRLVRDHNGHLCGVVVGKGVVAPADSCLAKDQHADSSSHLTTTPSPGTTRPRCARRSRGRRLRLSLGEHCDHASRH